MVNVSASQEHMKKPRLTYSRHIVITLITVVLTKIKNYIGIENTIASLPTNLGQYQLYCEHVQFNLLEGNRVSKALQNWLAS